ncbi:MAG: PIN domain-containing protein [Pseudomonadota bacterium]
MRRNLGRKWRCAWPIGTGHDEQRQQFENLTHFGLGDRIVVRAWAFVVNAGRGARLESVLAQPGVDEAEMPVEVLLASSFLPGLPPNDPADRIIIATARHYGYTVITRDRQILAYAAAGHVHAQDC